MSCPHTLWGAKRCLCSCTASGIVAGVGVGFEQGDLEALLGKASPCPCPCLMNPAGPGFDLPLHPLSCQAEVALGGLFTPRGVAVRETWETWVTAKQLVQGTGCFWELGGPWVRGSSRSHSPESAAGNEGQAGVSPGCWGEPAGCYPPLHL